MICSQRRAKPFHAVETIMRSGSGGQKVYLVPSLELVVVFTGGAFNVASPGNDIMTRVLLPAMLDAGTTVRPPAGAIDRDDSHLNGKAAAGLRAAFQTFEPRALSESRPSRVTTVRSRQLPH